MSYSETSFQNGSCLTSIDYVIDPDDDLTMMCNYEKYCRNDRRMYEAFNCVIISFYQVSSLCLIGVQLVIILAGLKK